MKIIKKENKFLFSLTFDRLNAVKTFYTSKDINLRLNNMLCESFIATLLFLSHERIKKKPTESNGKVLKSDWEDGKKENAVKFPIKINRCQHFAVSFETLV